MESASLAVTVLYSMESTKGLAIPLFVEVYNIHVRFFFSSSSSSYTVLVLF